MTVAPQPRRVDYFHDADAPEPTTRPVTVCVAVPDNSGRLLMIERTDNGAIALPSGAVDFGETIPEAAIRECFEETGYQIELTEFVGTFSDPGVIVEYRTENYEVRQECSIMYAGRVTAGAPKPSTETKTVRWIATADLDSELHIAPAMRRRIDVYHSQRWPHFG